MSSNRMTAATKDMIKKYFDKKISELDDKLGNRGYELSLAKIKELQDNQAYRDLIGICEQYLQILNGIDPDDKFGGKYYIERIIEGHNSNRFFKTPYRSDYSKLFGNDIEIENIIEQKAALKKQCNKILWNLEMAPKSSEAYKECLKEAEDILFNKEN